jgi:hypothetical protein
VPETDPAQLSLWPDTVDAFYADRACSIRSAATRKSWGYAYRRLQRLHPATSLGGFRTDDVVAFVTQRGWDGPRWASSTARSYPIVHAERSEPAPLPHVTKSLKPCAIALAVGKRAEPRTPPHSRGADFEIARHRSDVRGQPGSVTRLGRSSGGEAWGVIRAPRDRRSDHGGG